jgi:hypothetical protein
LNGNPLHHIPALSKESGDKEEMSEVQKAKLKKSIFRTIF